MSLSVNSQSEFILRWEEIHRLDGAYTDDEVNVKRKKKEKDESTDLLVCSIKFPTLPKIPPAEANSGTQDK